MFGAPLAVLSVLLAPQGSDTSNPFSDFGLQYGYDRVAEARESAKKGDLSEALQAFKEGISVARSSVMKLQEGVREDQKDDPQIAFDWLVEAYVESAQFKLDAGRIDDARSDAWAACVFTGSEHLPSLECFIEVCRSSDDQMGELSALRSLKKLLILNQDTDRDPKIEEITKRIEFLEAELDKKYSK